MQLTLDAVRAQGPAVTASADKHRIEKVKVFGSVLHGDSHKASDLDLLVWPREGADLFDLLHFKWDMEALFQAPVDVVSHRALHRAMRDDILKSAVEL